MISVLQKVRDYMYLSYTSVTDFSADAGLSTTSLNLFLRGKKKLDKWTAKRVERATKGYVLAQEIIDEQEQEDSEGGYAA